MLKTDQDFTIEQGTPLVQLVPFERQVVTAYTGNLSNKTIERYAALNSIRGLTFRGWRFFMREKKFSKVDAHDLEIPSDID